MSKIKSKQEILDLLNKKEGIKDWIENWNDWMDSWYDDDHYPYYIDYYFEEWLMDPSRLRDEKIDEILDISKKNQLKDFWPKTN